MSLRITEYGTLRWYDKQGRLHREDGPAVIFSDGEIIWYVHGTVHRTDGPAYISYCGENHWYLDGDEVPRPTEQTKPKPTLARIRRKITGV